MSEPQNLTPIPSQRIHTDGTGINALVSARALVAAPELWVVGVHHPPAVRLLPPLDAALEDGGRDARLAHLVEVVLHPARATGSSAARAPFLWAAHGQVSLELALPLRCPARTSDWGLVVVKEGRVDLPQ